MVMGEAAPRHGLHHSVRGALCWNGQGMSLPDGYGSCTAIRCS
jgi:hypothetical protein